MNKSVRHCLRLGLCCLIALSFKPIDARAGLSLTIDLYRANAGQTYVFYTPLATNALAPAAAVGTYVIRSPGWPASGSRRGFEMTPSGLIDRTEFDNENSYGDFNSAMQQITNGTWSILFTNATSTNLYIFTVSAPTINSNLIPATIITFPSDGALNVPNQPTFTWQGPTSWPVNGNPYVANYDFSFYQPDSIPAAQTSWTIPMPIPNGMNCAFRLNYVTNYTTSVFVAATPLSTNTGHAAISGWASATTLETGDGVSFAVTNPPSAGITLIAHYTFDNSGHLGQDSSGNGYDLDFNGGSGVTSSGTAAAGSGAASFDGSNFFSYTSTPSNVLSTLAGDFSLAFWIKTTQNNGNENGQAYNGAGIVAADVPGQLYDLVPAALDGGQIGFNTGPYDDTINSAADINNDSYHHVVITRNQATGEKKVYIDGSLDNSQFATLNPLSDPRLVAIGCQIDASQSDPNSANTADYFSGLLDDIQIYSGVLSSNLVAQLHANPGSTISSSGGHTLIAHYAFDDSGNHGLDSSGNGNDINCGSGWGPGEVFSTDAAAGGGALQFFGGSSITPCGQSFTSWTNALAGSFTVSAWIKTTTVVGNDGDDLSDSSGQSVVYADNNNRGATPVALTGSKVAFRTTDPDGNDDTLHSIQSVTTGNYVHIVSTRDRITGEKKIYINGTLDNSDVASTEFLTGAEYVSIGGELFSAYNGLVDDVQIYSGVLSASEVAELHNDPGSTAPDVAGNGGALGDAVNAPQLAWTTGGDLPWFTQTTNTHDSVSAAQSGAITNNEASWIETTVSGPGTLSFWWEVSSEQNADYLEFLIGGVWQNDMSGDSGWQQETYSIAAGSHTLRWNYYKDGSDKDFLDAGFLDEVSFVATPPDTNLPPVITLNPFSQTNHPGYNVALLAAATSNAAITWEWYKVGNATPIPNATNDLYIPANSGTASVAGNYFAIATNIVGSATTAVATVTFQNAALPPDWSRAFKTALTNNPADTTTDLNLASMLDSSGNIYSVGSVTGTNVFGSDILISPNGVEGSSFLKQTATGIPIWGRCMTNNGNGNSFPRGIAPAPGDGFYVFGLFSGTNWFGTNKLVDIGGASTYLARFDANGSNLWFRTITGTNANFPTHHTLVSDPAGNVTLSALISGYTSFGTTNLFVDGQRGILAQYDSNGNVRWVQVPSAWPDYLTYNGGCIYGVMGGNSTNYIGGVTNVADRRRALFSLNATTGQGNWVQAYAAQKDQGSPTGFNDNNALVTVSGTNLFLVGSAYGNDIEFGPYSVNFPNTVGQYFARYDTNGTAQLATSFGSRFTWPWAAHADASGNVYVGCDFDNYAIFGSNIIAAPFYETVQSVGTIDVRIPGQACVGKFDRNGNPLWARPAQSTSRYLNLRDITLASDGVWACGFFVPIGNFGTNTIYGGSSPYHLSGYLAKITDGAAVASPVTLLNPQYPGSTFQFQFLSQAGFNHSILYRTNLVVGNWRTNSSVAGDGTLKTISIPLSVFSPSKQGFVRVTTE